MSVAQQALRAARTMHGVLVLLSLLYLWVPSRIANLPTSDPGLPFELAIGLLALVCLGLAIFFRVRQVQPWAEKLHDDPNDRASAGKWRVGILLSFVFCECIVLFGLSLRIMGAGWVVCAPFYAVGLFFLLLWIPRLDLLPQ